MQKLLMIVTTFGNHNRIKIMGVRHCYVMESGRVGRCSAGSDCGGEFGETIRAPRFA
jgi:hypothetical protein